MSLFAVEVVLVEKESGDVRREDGRVDDQQKDNPVPDGFEGRIVQDRPFVNARRLQFVLGKHIGTQREDLCSVRKGGREYTSFNIVLPITTRPSLN